MPYSERTDPVESEVEPAAVRRVVESILQSAPFRTSKQCQDMLRYVVEHSLRNEPESLRERVIGIEVFGRNYDYDTSSDPVVRVRAADIRKRLAQYYQSAGPADAPVQIDIPSGSYRAVFRMLAQPGPMPAAEVVAQARAIAGDAVPVLVEPVQQANDAGKEAAKIRWSRRTVWMAVGLILLAALGAMWPLRALYFGRQSALKMFWAPVTASRKQVIIYAGSNAVYRLSDEFLDRYRKEHHIEKSGPEIFINLPPHQKIDAGDLVPVGDASADGPACALLVSLITRLHGTYDLRYGSNISVGDLEDSPTILVGAFNNPWTLKMTNPLRFVFRGGDRIEDTWHKLPGWSEVIQPDGEMTDDYAVVTRLLDPQSGHMLVTAAGIGSFGTQAAAEFLTNRQEMAGLEQKAPAGWQKKNLQIVLHETLRNGMLANQNIVAVQAW